MTKPFRNQAAELGTSTAAAVARFVVGVLVFGLEVAQISLISLQMRLVQHLLIHSGPSSLPLPDH